MKVDRKGGRMRIGSNENEKDVRLKVFRIKKYNLFS